jgi:pimeloyl-[acyl-carrier protein] synthase
MSSPPETSGVRPAMDAFWRGMFDPRNLDDPYPAYAQLREVKRVLKPSIGGDLAPWIVSGYAEVYEALRDVRFSSARRGPMLMRGNAELAERYANQGGGLGGASMIFSDPPEHTRLRGPVSKAFTPRRISGMRPRLEEIVDELLGPASARGSIELMDEFAGPLPATVIGELLGVPREDTERFRRWSNELFSRMGPPREAGSSAPEAGRALGQYLAGIIAERRKEPQDDLISGMIAAQEERQVLTDAELLSTSLVLLIAGFETTTNLIGNGVLALLRHPGQLERLRADRTLLPTAIEEFLRYDSPAQLVVRTTSEPIELGGEPLPAKAPVMLLLGAANRDPRQFPDPDRFDVGREENAHVSFGWGVHHCLGAPLARLEAEVAFSALLDRFPSWRADPAAIARRPNPMLRGLARLPLAF